MSITGLIVLIKNVIQLLYFSNESIFSLKIAPLTKGWEYVDLVLKKSFLLDGLNDIFILYKGLFDEHS